MDPTINDQCADRSMITISDSEHYRFINSRNLKDDSSVNAFFVEMSLISTAHEIASHRTPWIKSSDQKIRKGLY